MVKRVFLSLITVFASAGAASAATYKIDPDHSEVGFKIRHLAISNVTGNFTQFTGSFDFDPSNIAASKATAEISVPSIDTNQKKRDDHLKSAEFFEAEKFPAMKFVTEKVQPTGDKSFKAIGKLTIKNVTKPVTLDVVYQGTAKDPYGNERAAFSATTTINRQEFGLNWSKTLETGGLVVGDEVTISINIEGIKQAA